MTKKRAAPEDKPGGKKRGAQRLSLRQLEAWGALGYGMFLHFEMSTFDGDELSKGDRPSTLRLERFGRGGAGPSNASPDR